MEVLRSSRYFEYLYKNGNSKGIFFSFLYKYINRSTMKIERIWRYYLYITLNLEAINIHILCLYINNQVKITLYYNSNENLDIFIVSISLN